MRVLQAVSSMNAGGIETLLMSVFRAIDRSRIQFDFLYRTEDPCLFDEEIVSLGGRIHRVVPGFGAQRKLRSVFLENRYQIAHFHYSRLAYMEPYDVAGRCGVPTRIVHSHCTRSVTPDMRSRIAESLHKFNRARVRDAVRFACSRDAASWFGFDRPGGGWTFIPNAIDVGRFSFDDAKRREARAELGFGEDAFVVGSVGRLSLQKNQTFLLRVFSELQAVRPKSRLMIVGKGNLQRDLENEARSLGIAQKVIWLHDRLDTDRLYSAMDAFCFPSVFEGLGIALLEAQANGLHCFASDAVPCEAFVGGAKRVPLAAGTRAWAGELAMVPVGARRAHADKEVAAAGFDIKSVAEMLQEKYECLAARGSGFVHATD